jgi:hypothetical protein
LDFFGWSVVELGALGAELLPLLDVSLDEELELGLEGWALELDEELDGAGVLFRSTEPDIELELDGGVLAPEEDDDAEPEGEDGRVLLEDEEPFEERSRCAAGPLAFRSQPYRPLTATAIGTRTRADFFNKVIWRLLS